MQLSKCVFALLLAAPVFSSDGTPGAQPGLRVHEWGTFTSVAGEDGGPQPWTPLAGSSDLPCFVKHLGAKCIKCAPASTPQRPSTVPTSTVRMETPVLYFYAPRRMTLSVHVDFPRGWITEWYPQAAAVSPQMDFYGAQPPPPLESGSIDWSGVEIVPGPEFHFPTGEGASHYYAARNTDASPLITNGQTEKFLFYRGIANLDVPLWVRAAGERKVELRNRSDAPLPLTIVFENRGGQIGYRMMKDLSGAAQVDLPELTGDLGRLKQELAAALVSKGLYEKEAAAMIETWRDSWLEEGMRVFYIVPRSMVDRALPLAIKPAPAAVERVFVGRVEVLSPHSKSVLTTAIGTGDTDELAKYGRFLEAFVRQIRSADIKTSPAAAAFFKTRFDAALRQVDSPSCVR